MAGLEVLFAVAKDRFRNNDDAAVCCLHWNLISNGFRCVGVGEEVSESPEQTELLPEGWNTTEGLYCLLYQPSGTSKTHLLKIIPVDGILLVHFMRIGDDRVRTMNVTASDYVTGDLSAFKSAFKNLQQLETQVKKELIDSPAAARPTANQRTDRRRTDDDVTDPLRVPGTGRRPPPPEWAEQSDPFAVGRGDLDPLAGGLGGGMLMDPRRGMGRGGGFGPDPSAGLPGRLPRGAIPPGARFDPFGPPDLDGSGGRGRGGRVGPDPDHLPPPGFDDMFM